MLRILQQLLCIFSFHKWNQNPTEQRSSHFRENFFIIGYRNIELAIQHCTRPECTKQRLAWRWVEGTIMGISGTSKWKRCSNRKAKRIRSLPEFKG